MDEKSSVLNDSFVFQERDAPYVLPVAVILMYEFLLYVLWKYAFL